MYDMGPDRIAPPVWNCQSGFPVVASSAKKLPSLDPLKTSPPAVAMTPAHVGVGSGKSHSALPVLTSMARTAPHASSSRRFSLPPVYYMPGLYSTPVLK